MARVIDSSITPRHVASNSGIQAKDDEVVRAVLTTAGGKPIVMDCSDYETAISREMVSSIEEARASSMELEELMKDSALSRYELSDVIAEYDSVASRYARLTADAYRAEANRVLAIMRRSQPKWKFELTAAERIIVSRKGKFREMPSAEYIIAAIPPTTASDRKARVAELLATHRRVVGLRKATEASSTEETQE